MRKVRSQMAPEVDVVCNSPPETPSGTEKDTKLNLFARLFSRKRDGRSKQSESQISDSTSSSSRFLPKFRSRKSRSKFYAVNDDAQSDTITFSKSVSVQSLPTSTLSSMTLISSSTVIPHHKSSQFLPQSISVQSTNQSSSAPMKTFGKRVQSRTAEADNDRPIKPARKKRPAPAPPIRSEIVNEPISSSVETAEGCDAIADLRDEKLDDSTPVAVSLEEEVEAMLHSRASSHSSGFDETLSPSAESPFSTLESQPGTKTFHCVDLTNALFSDEVLNINEGERSAPIIENAHDSLRKTESDSIWAVSPSRSETDGKVEMSSERQQEEEVKIGNSFFESQPPRSPKKHPAPPPPTGETFNKSTTDEIPVHSRPRPAQFIAPPPPSTPPPQGTGEQDSSYILGTYGQIFETLRTSACDANTCKNEAKTDSCTQVCLTSRDSLCSAVQSERSSISSNSATNSLQLKNPEENGPTSEKLDIMSFVERMTFLTQNVSSDVDGSTQQDFANSSFLSSVTNSDQTSSSQDYNSPVKEWTSSEWSTPEHRALLTISGVSEKDMKDGVSSTNTSWEDPVGIGFIIQDDDKTEEINVRSPNPDSPFSTNATCTEIKISPNESKASSRYVSKMTIKPELSLQLESDSEKDMNQLTGTAEEVDRLEVATELGRDQDQQAMSFSERTNIVEDQFQSSSTVETLHQQGSKIQSQSGDQGGEEEEELVEEFVLDILEDGTCQMVPILRKVSSAEKRKDSRESTIQANPKIPVPDDEHQQNNQKNHSLSSLRLQNGDDKNREEARKRTVSETDRTLDSYQVAPRASAKVVLQQSPKIHSKHSQKHDEKSTTVKLDTVKTVSECNDKENVRRTIRDFEELTEVIPLISNNTHLAEPTKVNLSQLNDAQIQPGTWSVHSESEVTDHIQSPVLKDSPKSDTINNSLTGFKIKKTVQVTCDAGLKFKEPVSSKNPGATSDRKSSISNNVELKDHETVRAPLNIYATVHKSDKIISESTKIIKQSQKIVNVDSSTKLKDTEPLVNETNIRINKTVTVSRDNSLKLPKAASIPKDASPSRVQTFQTKKAASLDQDSGIFTGTASEERKFTSSTSFEIIASFPPDDSDLEKLEKGKVSCLREAYGRLIAKRAEEESLEAKSRQGKIRGKFPRVQQAFDNGQGNSEKPTTTSPLVSKEQIVSSPSGIPQGHVSIASNSSEYSFVSHDTATALANTQEAITTADDNSLGSPILKQSSKLSGVIPSKPKPSAHPNEDIKSVSSKPRLIKKGVENVNPSVLSPAKSAHSPKKSVNKSLQKQKEHQKTQNEIILSCEKNSDHAESEVNQNSPSGKSYSLKTSINKAGSKEVNEFPDLPLVSHSSSSNQPESFDLDVSAPTTNSHMEVTDGLPDSCSTNKAGNLAYDSREKSERCPCGKKKNSGSILKSSDSFDDQSDGTKYQSETASENDPTLVTTSKLAKVYKSGIEGADSSLECKAPSTVNEADSTLVEASELSKASTSGIEGADSKVERKVPAATSSIQAELAELQEQYQKWQEHLKESEALRANRKKGSIKAAGDATLPENRDVQAKREGEAGFKPKAKESLQNRSISLQEPEVGERSIPAGKVRSPSSNIKMEKSNQERRRRPILPVASNEGELNHENVNVASADSSVSSKKPRQTTLNSNNQISSKRD